MPHFLAEDDDWDGEQHDQHIYASLRAESIDISGFRHPWNDAVQEAEGDDVLSMWLTSNLNYEDLYWNVP